ncbi:MAG: TIR domain-containing protein [Alcanivoracaceae bacterium]|nr:TIR domain-containing protein [Alcanivoracaceae bacterium]
MKVFISWSGERSRRVADLLDEWIQCVLQGARPWMSSKDIDRGALWFSEIADQLADTKIGIVCLTQENKNKPWILFESGALAKGLSSSRVCTFLVDLYPSDISNPLAQFNHTMPTKEQMYSLVSTINSFLEDRILDDKVLNRVFETYWPQFESEYNQIITETVTEEIVEQRSDQSLLQEVLETVRSMDKRVRTLEVRRRMPTRTPPDENRLKELMNIEKNPLFHTKDKARISDLAALFNDINEKQAKIDSGKEES